MYSTYGDSKSVVVERFNRTLKNYMWKYFTSHNTRKYIDIIQKILDFYNNKIHRTIKMSPIDASKKINRNKVFNNMYQNIYTIDKSKNNLKLNDYVRISRIKGTFEKGYIPNWSREIFQIEKILKTNPITYKIKEEDGTIIEGSFYEQELQKTNKPEFFDVEKIIKQKKVKDKLLYYVKWLGYDDKYNSWVDSKQIKLNK
jgi:hypothetical protein